MYLHGGVLANLTCTESWVDFPHSHNRRNTEDYCSPDTSTYSLFFLRLPFLLLIFEYTHTHSENFFFPTVYAENISSQCPSYLFIMRQNHIL